VNAGATTLRHLHRRGELHLRVDCSKCPRRGRYLLVRLLADHGDKPLPDLLAELARDCPHRSKVGVFDRCGAKYLGL
jgi:hypothetical protein